MHYARLIAVAGFFTACFTGLRRYSAFREARKTEAVLRDRLFAHLQRLHFAFHDGQQTGQLDEPGQQRPPADPERGGPGPAHHRQPGHRRRRAGDPRAGSTRSSPCWPSARCRRSTCWPRSSPRKLQPTMTGVQQESAELSAVVEETVAGIRVVKGFAAEDTQASRLSRRGRRPLRGVDGGGRDPLGVLAGPRAAAQRRADHGAGLRRPPGDQRDARAGRPGRRSTPTSCCWSGRCGCSGWIVAMSQRAAASAQRVHEILADRAARGRPGEAPAAARHRRRRSLRRGGVPLPGQPAAWSSTGSTSTSPPASRSPWWAPPPAASPPPPS